MWQRMRWGGEVEVLGVFFSLVGVEIERERKRKKGEVWSGGGGT